MNRRALHHLSSALFLSFAFLAAGACSSDDGGKSGAGGSVASGGGSGGSISGGSGGVVAGGSGGIGTGGLASGGVSGAGTGGLDAGSDAPVDPGPYPGGPYGNAVGDTIANVAWEGYVNVTGAASSDTLPYVDYSTDEMRKSGKAYGLIHVSLQG